MRVILVVLSLAVVALAMRQAPPKVVNAFEDTKIDLVFNDPLFVDEEPKKPAPVMPEPSLIISKGGREMMRKVLVMIKKLASRIPLLEKKDIVDELDNFGSKVVRERCKSEFSRIRCRVMVQRFIYKNYQMKEYNQFKVAPFFEHRRTLDNCCGRNSCCRKNFNHLGADSYANMESVRRALGRFLGMTFRRKPRPKNIYAAAMKTQKKKKTKRAGKSKMPKKGLKVSKRAFKGKKCPGVRAQVGSNVCRRRSTKTVGLFLVEVLRRLNMPGDASYQVPGKTLIEAAESTYTDLMSRRQKKPKIGTATPSAKVTYSGQNPTHLTINAIGIGDGAVGGQVNYNTGVKNVYNNINSN